MILQKLRDYHRLHKARKRLNVEGLTKKDIENIKELISNRKGKTKNDNHQNEE